MDEQEHPDVTLERALALHMENETEAARALYLQILAIQPDHHKALLNLASIDLDEGELESCIGRASAVVKQGIKDPAAELLLARAHFLTNDHDAGYAHMAKAFALAPQDPGIAYEHTAALRRKYWTHRDEEYADLIELAQSESLPISRLPRFVHQAYAKIIRPEFINIFVRGPQQGEPDVPAIETWMGKLPAGAAKDLEVLSRNFLAAISVMHGQPEYRAREARVGLRDGSAVDVKEFSDLDPLTMGTIEFIDEEGELRFESMANMAQVRFGAPGAAIDCQLTMLDGRELNGFMPIFYALTEFSQHEGVRNGNTTLLRTVLEGVRVPIGLRQFNCDERMVAAVGVSWIEFS